MVERQWSQPSLECYRSGTWIETGQGGWGGKLPLGWLEIQLGDTRQLVMMTQRMRKWLEFMIDPEVNGLLMLEKWWSSWWLNQPHSEKYAQVKFFIISPKVPGWKFQKYLKGYHLDKVCIPSGKDRWNNPQVRWRFCFRGYDKPRRMGVARTIDPFQVVCLWFLWSVVSWGCILVRSSGRIEICWWFYWTFWLNLLFDTSTKSTNLPDKIMIFNWLLACWSCSPRANCCFVLPPIASASLQEFSLLLTERHCILFWGCLVSS